MGSGIVRKVDDLGRIVIPKEIRNSLFIKEGSPMEISVSGEDILLKKCNLLENIAEIACKYCNILFEVLDFPVLITDAEKVVCSVGLSKKQYQDKPISDNLKRIIHKSENYTASDEYKTTLLPIIQKDELKFNSQVIIPIMLDGKCEGLIVLLSFDRTPTNVEVKTMQVVSKLITRHLSNQ